MSDEEVEVNHKAKVKGMGEANLAQLRAFNAETATWNGKCRRCGTVFTNMKLADMKCDVCNGK